MPMCDQSTACNPHWQIRSRQRTIKRVHWFTPDLIQRTQYCHRSTMNNITFKHTPCQNTGTTDYIRYMCVCSREPPCKSVLENGQDKTQKASPKKRYIMEHSPGLPQDTKSLRSWQLWKPSEMLLKDHQTLSAQIRQWLMGANGDALCVAWRLSLTQCYNCIQFNSSKVTPLDHYSCRGHGTGLCYCNSNNWG